MCIFRQEDDPRYEGESTITVQWEKLRSRGDLERRKRKPEDFVSRVCEGGRNIK